MQIRNHFIFVRGKPTGNSLNLKFNIDSVWTSKRKANKRCKELNSVGKEYLWEEYGISLYDVDCYPISK